MVNSDAIDPTVWAAAYAASGMDSYAYQPPSVPVDYSSWPTLQEMIDSGKRAVNFLAQNADMSTAPYLLDEFSMIWETPFGVSRRCSSVIRPGAHLPLRTANGRLVPLHCRSRRASEWQDG